jgi:hypothetical protein
MATAKPACSAICSLEKHPDDNSAAYIRSVSAADTNDTLLVAGASSCLALPDAIAVMILSLP